MLDAYSHAAPSHAHATSQPAAVGAGPSSAELPLRPSSLTLATRQLESQLGMLLATFHDDAGFWPAFTTLMQGLETELTQAERSRLRSHADFLLVRAGMSSWTLIGATPGTTARAVAAAAR
ncbi:hypothetical protein OCJ37_03710 [Xanthomonas sp. AM6]|uniref:hypothetical protein n=1 Tax=Xanthomonas sp. AM6 TaxID=2982531 RepID=UPI0021D98693|nr:hypothetical protein [Xanthomonas sp. AM6]UYB53073.1 hypothetical protein OCJ37_03710 [Xanthomonas sp. AM6]